MTSQQPRGQEQRLLWGVPVCVHRLRYTHLTAGISGSVKLRTITPQELWEWGWGDEKTWVWGEEGAQRGQIFFSSEPLCQLTPKSKELSYKVAERGGLPVQGGGEEGRVLIWEAYHLRLWLGRVLPPLPGALQPPTGLLADPALPGLGSRKNQSGAQDEQTGGRGGVSASVFALGAGAVRKGGREGSALAPKSVVIFANKRKLKSGPMTDKKRELRPPLPSGKGCVDRDKQALTCTLSQHGRNKSVS